MGTTLVRVYNDALRHLGERKLASAAVVNDARYALDDAITEVKAFCLEQGFWNFAMRSVSATASLTLTPSFGFTYAFEKPTDWVRTYIISPDELLKSWLRPFNDENGVWWCNQTPIYVKYISNDSSYGYDLGAWPQTFADYVATRLALRAGPAIKSISAELVAALEQAERKALFTAKNKDAMNEAPDFPPQGTWTRARSGGASFNSTSRGLT